MEAAVLIIFAAALVSCVAAGISVLYAMLAGYALFFAYGIIKKHSVRDMLCMSLKGMNTVKSILVVFLLIGILTAVWRFSGTIPMIICSAAKFVRPAFLLPAVFLINCLVSLLIGTSFGTAATVGTICMAIGRTAGISTVLLGGAILAGAFFGDRCSPMSTSAHLVCELTETDIYGNIKNMINTAVVPFALSCVICGAIGLRYAGSEFSTEALDILRNGFDMHWILLVPAVLIILMSLMRINIRWVMLTSIVISAVLSLTVQNAHPGEIIRYMISGYRAPTPELASMLDGGGLISMVEVSLIVLISASYSGIFDGTGMIDGLKDRTAVISRKTSTYAATFAAGILAALISSNQTLAIIMTKQLSSDNYTSASELALDLEDTAVVMSPLVPWSIASAVPLSVIGAPSIAVTAAFYLYLLPLSRLLKSFLKRK